MRSCAPCCCSSRRPSCQASKPGRGLLESPCGARETREGGCDAARSLSGPPVGLVRGRTPRGPLSKTTAWSYRETVRLRGEGNGSRAAPSIGKGQRQYAASWGDVDKLQSTTRRCLPARCCICSLRSTPRFSPRKEKKGGGRRLLFGRAPAAKPSTRRRRVRIQVQPARISTDCCEAQSA